MKKIIEKFEEIGISVATSNKVDALLKENKISSEELINFIYKIHVEPENLPAGPNEVKVFSGELNGFEFLGVVTEDESIIISLSEEKDEIIEFTTS